MKRWFRIAAFVIAATTLGLWAALGAHTGWSKNRVQEMRTDDVTGLEQPIWRETWIPGVDFVGVGLACSGCLLVASLLIRPKQRWFSAE